MDLGEIPSFFFHDFEYQYFSDFGTSPIDNTLIMRSNDGQESFIARYVSLAYIVPKTHRDVTSAVYKYASIATHTITPPLGIVLPSQNCQNHYAIFSPLEGYRTLQGPAFNDPVNNPPVTLNDTEKSIIAYGIISGLNDLHKQNIVHGNLDLCSIILTEENKPKIYDFFYTAIESRGPYDSYINEPSIFQAPEVLSAGTITSATDIYSFGTILAFMLMGKLKKHEGTEQVLGNMHQLLSITPNGTKFFQDLILRCCEPNPAKRPTAEEIMKDLENPQNILFAKTDMKALKNYIDETKTPIEMPELPSLESLLEYFDKIDELRDQAEGPNPDAQYKLGYHLLHNLSESQYSVSYIKKAADAGNVAAQLATGFLLSNPKASGPQCDDSLALCYFKAASEQGNIEATTQYAEFLHMGRGCQRNATLAAKLFKIAADKGDPQGLLSYSSILRTGDGVAVNIRESFKYLKKAAEVGGGNANFLLSLAYQCGEGTPKHCREGLRLLKLAYEQGFDGARIAIEDLKAAGEKLVKKPSDVFKKSHNHADHLKADNLMMYTLMLITGGPDVPKDTKTAAKILKIAAQKGYAEAQFEYSALLAKGDGVPQNEKEALFYLQHSAQNGFVDAQIMYSEHLLKTKKLGDAVKYIKSAAEQGSARAQLTYGTMLYEGKAGKPNASEAARYVKMAAEQGYPAALIKLGSFYETATGVPYDDAKAMYNYRQAAKLGDTQAYKELARLLTTGPNKSYHEAARIYQRLAAMGDLESVANLADLYTSGLGIGQSFGDAVEILTTGEAKSDPACMLRFAKLQYRGKGTEQDTESAVNLFKELYEAGDADAGNCLGYSAYKAGRTAEAAQVFKEAAMKGSMAAAFNYACLIHNGEVETSDPNLEKQYLNMASGGFPLGMFYLAEMLSQEPPPDSIQVSLYKDAAEGGHIPSTLKAAICYDRMAQNKSPDAYISPTVLENAYELYRRIADFEVNKTSAPEWFFYVDTFTLEQPFFKSPEAYQQDASNATLRLAEMLLSGQGCNCNLSVGRRYLEKAAKMGNKEAYYQLGQCYERGVGVAINFDEALKAYKSAHELGHAQALSAMLSLANKETQDPVLGDLDTLGALSEFGALSSIAGFDLKDTILQDALKAISMPPADDPVVAAEKERIIKKMQKRVKADGSDPNDNARKQAIRKYCEELAMQTKPSGFGSGRHSIDKVISKLSKKAGLPK